MHRKTSIRQRFDHHRFMVSHRYVIPTLQATAEAQKVNEMPPEEFDTYCRRIAAKELEAAKAENPCLHCPGEQEKWLEDYRHRRSGRRPQAPYKKPDLENPEVCESCQ